ARLGLDVEVSNLENPRDEMEDHYYRADHQHLFDLGYKPTHDVEAEMEIMLRDLSKYRDRIEAKRGVLIPDVHWNGRREKVRFLPVGVPGLVNEKLTPHATVAQGVSQSVAGESGNIAQAD